jgi:glycosyltransferase involved in cell wall biosynthesis
MNAGFACIWDKQPERTWSFAPWNLREVLRACCDSVRDAPVAIPEVCRLALLALHARRANGRWTSHYKYSPQWMALRERLLRRQIERSDVDVVLEIGDLASLRIPFFLYQDLDYDVLLEFRGRTYGSTRGSPELALGTLLRLRDRQAEIYDRCSGVFAMSRWFAERLVAHSGLPRDKVHVGHAGTNAPPPARSPRTQSRRRDRQARLLFVGTNFIGKGGDLVVQAFETLRKQRRPDAVLTIAGPSKWPLPGKIPTGVDFLGSVPISRLAQLHLDHDLFVMPSRFEGFGIVFAEALSAGIPCIGRDAFAMPEIIEDGVTGYLLDGDDPPALSCPGPKLPPVNTTAECDTRSGPIRWGGSVVARFLE